MTVASESSPQFLSNDEKAWPPGFRFHPTDEELVLYYLKRKMCSKTIKHIIGETDVYKWHPQELPGQSVLKTGDRQWFFFSPRDRKYPNSARSSRATKHGYWKATGKDRNITCNSRAVGVKKTLVFYFGRAPNGKRTDWVMHEYTLDEEELKRCTNIQDYYALYKVYQKSGPGPKNGEQYGAPFKEEEWEKDDYVDFNVNPAHDELHPMKQFDEVTSVDTVGTDSQLQTSLNDDIEEFMKQVVDNPVLQFNQPQHAGFAYALPQAFGGEESQSQMVDPSIEGMKFSQPDNMFHPSGQQSQTQPSHDHTQSAISHLHLCEALEVCSAPNHQDQVLQNLKQDDFLEMDDLLGPEPTVSDTGNLVQNLQFEKIDGLSEFDLYHDASMFLSDMGLCPAEQEIVSHPYMNHFDIGVSNQDYQFPLYEEDTNQIASEFRAQDQRIDGFRSAESVDASCSLPTSACESANSPTDASQNGNVEGGATSRFSSALWAFLDSIPTTPASASENALVNRAFERMSSFRRLRMNCKHTDVAASDDGGSMRRAGIKGTYFLFFPILVALCAFLWISLGSLRLFRDASHETF